MSLADRLRRSSPHAGAPFLLAYALLAVGLPVVYLRQPLHFDEQIFLVVAEEVTTGDRLYRETIDHKPPGIFAVAVAATAVTGSPIVATRLATYLATAVSGLLVVAFGRTVVDERTAWTAGCLFVTCCYLPHFDGFFFMTEPWAVPTMLVAALAFFADRRGTDLLAGGAMAVGVAFNQTVFLFGATFVLFRVATLWESDRRTGRYVRRSTRQLLVVGVGFLLAVTVWLAAFAAVGSLEALIEWTVAVPLTGYSTPFDAYGHALAAVTLLPVWLLAAAGVVTVARRHLAAGVDDRRLFLAVWAAVVSLPGTLAFDGDHKYLLAFPAIAILVAIVLRTVVTDHLPRVGRDVARRRVSRSTLVVGVVVVATIAAVGANAIYLDSLTDRSLADDEEAAASVDERLDGAVYTYPGGNRLFLFAEDLDPAVRWRGTIYSPRIVDSVLTDLERTDVRHVVVRRGHVENGRVVARGYWVAQKRPLVEYLNRRYEPTGTVGDYVIFERVDDRSSVSRPTPSPWTRSATPTGEPAVGSAGTPAWPTTSSRPAGPRAVEPVTLHGRAVSLRRPS